MNNRTKNIFFVLLLNYLKLFKSLFNGNFLEGFYYIAFVNIVVVFDLQTAIVTFAHFFYVVFETLE